jgi:hypothetical protein
VTLDVTPGGSGSLLIYGDNDSDVSNRTRQWKLPAR